MSTRHVLTGLCLVLAACSDDCTCGEGQSPDEPAQGATTTTPQVVPPPGPLDPDAWRDPGVDSSMPFVPVDAGAATGTVHDREGGHFARLASPDLPRFEALQAKLATAPVKVSELASGAKLAGVLPSALGHFTATGEVTEGPQSAGKDPIVSRARQYTYGPQRMLVKVTDTGTAPLLREDYTRRLTLRGDAAVGHMAPAIVGGHVVLEAFFQRGHASWLVALVGGRYLVEVRGRGVNDRKAASVAFQQLKLSGLGN